MPREYQLKRPTMDLNRLKKVAKSVLDDSKKDREHALEYLRVFRAMLTENPNDDASKKAITDCLKLAQTSKGNVVKVLDLMIKLENIDNRTNTSNHKIDLFRDMSDE